MKRLLLFSFILLVFSCNSSKAPSSGKQDSDRIEGTSSNNALDKTNLVSPDGQYTLRIKKNDSKATAFTVLKDDSKVYEDTFVSGYVKWYDTHRLEIFESPGTIPPSKTKNDFIIVYDVESKSKVTKAELEGPDNN